MRSSVNRWAKVLIPLKGRGWLIVMLFQMMVTAVIGVMLPQITTEFYRDFNREGLHAFMILGGFFLVEYVNRIIYQVSTYKYVQHLLLETRQKTFGRWLSSPLKVNRVHSSETDFPLGEVLARVMSDTDSVKELVTSGAFGIFIDLIFILSSLIGFFRIEGQLALGLIGIEALAALGLVWGSRKMAKVFASVRQSTGHLSRVVADVTNGLRELSFTPHEHYASKRGEKVFDDFLNKQLKANVWDSGYYSAAESLYPILLALVLVFLPEGGGLARVTVMAVLIDLIQKSITPIKELAGKISNIQRAKTGLERIKEFQEIFSTDSAPPRPERLQLQSFSLDLKSYAYPPRQGETPFAIKDIHLSGKPGDLLGIIGQSGCGKSTLLRLLSGQHEHFDGVVKINSETLRGNNPAELQRLSQWVSLVSQDSHVFSASVVFNVALKESDPGFMGFWERARTALPYLVRWGITPETVIDPKKLSMGQKQLLSGLRACYLQKPIVLLDEVSSGLDPDLEKALRDLVLFIQERSLTIIVTHRLETIRNANWLVVMKEGILAEEGTPLELQKKDAHFAEFLKHLHT